MLNVSMARFGPVLVIGSPLVLYRVRPNSLSHSDAQVALGYIAANVAARFGVGTLHENAGPLYRHLLLGVARAATLPSVFVLGFAALARMPLHDLARFLVTQLGAKLRSRKAARVHEHR